MCVGGGLYSYIFGDMGCEGPRMMGKWGLEPVLVEEGALKDLPLSY